MSRKAREQKGEGWLDASAGATHPGGNGHEIHEIKPMARSIHLDSRLPRREIGLTVNGTKYRLSVASNELLLNVLRENFERLGIEVFYTTEDGSFGERGVITQPFVRFLKSAARKELRIYACGPWGMMKAIHALSVQANVQCEVSLEARMGCSLGACLGCVVRSKDHAGEDQFLRVCQDGPVMNSRLIDWDTAPV